ncbi:MAG: hypothetical protein ACRDGH_14380 [Candidatus Limnocylindria bacterium]
MRKVGKSLREVSTAIDAKYGRKGPLYTYPDAAPMMERGVTRADWGR